MGSALPFINREAPRQLASGAPHHLGARFRDAKSDGPYQWHYVEHHIAHGASAFHASPFDEAAVMTLEAGARRATTSYAVGRGANLERIGQVNFPALARDVV